MAELLNGLPTNLTEYPNSFKRQTPSPLEMYSVFYSKADADNYAQTNGVAYVGQIVTVVEEGVVTHYSIEADSSLKILGSSDFEEDVPSKYADPDDITYEWDETGYKVECVNAGQATVTMNCNNDYYLVRLSFGGGEAGPEMPEARFVKINGNDLYSVRDTDETGYVETKYIDYIGPIDTIELYIPNTSSGVTFEKFIKLSDFGYTHLTVGRRTEENSEVFNDYTNNKAVGAYSSASGSYTYAGANAFEFVQNITYTTSDGTDGQTGKYYLTSIDGIKDLLDKNIKPKYSIILSNNFDFNGVITGCGMDSLSRNYVEVTNYLLPGASRHVTPYVDGTKSVDITKIGTSSYFLLPEYPELGTKIIGTAASASGYNSKAQGVGASAEGGNNIAAGKYSHAEGRETVAGYAAHAEGRNTKAIGENAHSEGYSTKAYGSRSHAEGVSTYAGLRGFEILEVKHVGPGNTKINKLVLDSYEGLAVNDIFYATVLYNANSTGSSASTTSFSGKITSLPSPETPYIQFEGSVSSNLTEDSFSTSIYDGSTSKHKVVYKKYSQCTDEEKSKILYIDTSGNDLGANSICIPSKPEVGTRKLGYAVHASGYKTVSTVNSSHAEGADTIAHGRYSHAEGYGTKAVGEKSHAEGSGSLASNDNAHAEGTNTTASGSASHAEGDSTKATGQCAHSEGAFTSANAPFTHAGGKWTCANHNDSFTHGRGLTTGRAQQAVFGIGNSVDTAALFIIGDGTVDSNGTTTRSHNAFCVYENSIKIGDTVLTEEMLKKLVELASSLNII